MIAALKKTSSCVKSTLLSGFLILAVVGCGGGMGSHSSSRMERTFVDSAVQGLHYTTATQSGITDEGGTFMYMPGETIVFYIEDMELGTASAQSVMTPAHMVEGAEDETGPTVSNMGMLMQSLDEDGNLDNGITISSEVSEEVSNTDIDIYLNTTDFENQDKITQLFGNMSEMEFLPDGDRMIVTPEEAQEHMREYMMPYIDSGMGQGIDDDDDDMMM